MSLVKKLDVLTGITEALSGVETTAEIFDFILSSLQELFEVDHAAIFLTDDSRERLHLVCSRGYGEEDRPGITLSTGSGTVGAAFTRNSAVRVSDVKNSSEHYITADDRVMSGIAAPLRVQDRPVGVLNVESLSRQFFSDKDLKFLSLFAAETAAFIHRFNVERKLQETTTVLDDRVRQLTTLTGVSRNIVSSLSYEKVLERILHALRDTVKTGDRFAFIVFDERSGELVVRSVLGHSRNLVNRFALKPEQGITGAAFSAGREVLVPDVDSDHRFIPGPMKNAGSEMAIPLVVQDTSVGVIDIVSSQKHAFNGIETEFIRTLADFSSVAIGNSQLFEQNEQAFFDTIRLLAEALDARDNYTRGHSERVTEYTIGILDEIGADESEREQISYSAILHDIGKIGISDLILNKKSTLTTEEFSVIRSHVTVGERILSDARSMKHISRAVKYHHERWDGNGYPDGLAGKQIPLSARIIAVADAYDAMTSTRPYRRPLAQETALREIDNNRGTQFDSEVVDAFFSFIERTRT